MISRVKNVFNNLTFVKKQFVLHYMNKNFTAEQLLEQRIKPRKRTKTVCTISPQTDNIETLIKLIDNGLSVARLNFNNGDHEAQRKIMLNIQKALDERKSGYVSTLMDLKGPRITTGKNADTHREIILKKGQLLEFTTDYSHLGTNTRIGCSYKDLPNSTKVGNKIIFAKGDIVTRVKKIEGQIVTVEVKNDGKLGSNSYMCLPDTPINLPTISKADQHDIINFGLKYRVNYITVSFARYRQDIEHVRNLLKKHDPEYGPYVQILSKLENREAIKNIDELIEVSDGIMIARGALGMEIPLRKVVLLQKFIASKAMNAGKFVFAATQMLESMQSKPKPTRAQISDVTNSVFDLTDANMTSGETSLGNYPVEASGVLKQVAQQTEAFVDYKRIFQDRKYLINYRDRRDVVGAIALAFQLDCYFIFVKTDSIALIAKISSLRPKAYVIVFTNKIEVKGACNIRFGVYCYSKDQFKDSTDFLKSRGFKYGYHEKDPITVLEIQTEGEKIVSQNVVRKNT